MAALEMKVKVTVYNVHNVANINSVQVIRRIVTVALTVSDILTFQIRDLENLFQDNEIQHLQWSQSSANMNLDKSRYGAFVTSSRRLRHIQTFNI